MNDKKPTVIIIPPKPEAAQASKRQLRVAAYCRVSTDDEEQLTSYEAQKNYYTDKIMTNKEWTMAGIFADEGITGTSARKRPEFLRMIRQCKQGKIDIILTKSISRFARNTVDCLNYIRALKELGIAVIFEKENINTLEADSEILITMLGAFAQSESESISSNVRWGKRQAMKEGKATIQYKYLYGYRKGADGKPEIIPEQAEVVRRIYDLFLSGTSIRDIKEYLEQNNIRNVDGEVKWARNAINSILTNEKYCGDVLLQKTYIDDCINKKVKKNTGQLPMYLVQNHHEGIISREIFDAAQAELARRNAGKSPSKKNAPTGRSRYSSKYALTDRLYCGECGTRYQRCTWRNHDGSKRIVWRCVSRVDYGHKYCHNSPTLDEVPLQNAILAAINKSASEKSNIVYLLNSAMEKELAPISGQALSISDIEHRLEELKAEFDKLLVKAANIEDQSALNDRFRSVLQEQTELKLKRDELQNALINNDALSLRMTACKQALDTVPATITDWDEALIRQVVDSVRVDVDGTISVTLKSGKTVLEKGRWVRMLVCRNILLSTKQSATSYFFSITNTNYDYITALFCNN